MMMNREFRKVLEECLERVRQGEPVQACLEAHPQSAERLGPFLRAASILWGMNPPKPSAAIVAAARSKLLERVAGDRGGKEAVVRGILKFAHVAGVAVGALFLASMGLVAAAGPGLFTGPFSDDKHDPEAVTFTAKVMAVSETLFVVDTEKGSLRLELSDKTHFQGPSGEEIEWAAIEREDRIFVRATFVREHVFHALLIRLLAHGEEPEPNPVPPKPEPSPEPPKPEPSPVPPKPAPEQVPPPAPQEVPPAPVEVIFEGKVFQVGSGSFVLKNSAGVMTTILFNGETVFSGHLVTGVFARVTAWQMPDGSILARQVTISPSEFWGTVTGIGGGTLTLQTPSGTVLVHTTAETLFPAGAPFVGVKVWVLGYKQADGSFLALKVTVKTAAFSGVVQAMDAGTLVVVQDTLTYTVHTDANTAYPNGQPFVEAKVFVSAYLMGDGSYLAFEVKVTGQVFTGVITSHLPAQFTIYVQVGSEPAPREVCYEFASVFGTLAVGATVEVWVDHITGPTYFAAKVKVLI